MHKIKDLLYFVQWAFRKNPYPIVITVLIFQQIAVGSVYGYRGFAISVLILAFFGVIFLLLLFINGVIITPIKNAYKEYKQEKQQTFNSLKNSR